MNEKIEVERSDLEKIYDALKMTTEFHVHRDKMNAKLHKSEETRYSPLTSTLLAERERLENMLSMYHSA